MKVKVRTNRGYSNKFHAGDIVYWVEKNLGGKYEVKWGRIDECDCDGCYIDFLEPYENRSIKPLYSNKSVPVQEWKNTDEWHKLPKDWTYNTHLYEVVYEPRQDIPFHIRDSNSLRKLFNDGILVKSSTKFHGNIESEVTKEGYRILLVYPMWEHYRNFTHLEYSVLHKNWNDAEIERQEQIAELKRQSALTDEEWSKEQIEKVLTRYANLQGVEPTDPLISRIRDYLFSMKNIEDLCARLTHEGIQWKYEKNKKWNTVNENVF